MSLVSKYDIEFAPEYNIEDFATRGQDAYLYLWSVEG